jgi:carbamoyl-phosphate synthase large subunit
MNILITAASRRVPLVQAFQSVLRTERRGRVIVTDVNATSPAVHVAHRAYRVPLATDPGYVDALLAICAAEQIRLVVPTVDDELEIVAEARPRFATLGALIACSSAETAALCNDKYRTCTHLRAHGVEAAATWLPHALPEDLPDLLFIKPRVGRGGVGAYIIRNRRERDFFIEYVANPVIQEFLQSPEYTIDLLCDWNGRPLSIVPRERTVIRSGVSDRGRTVRSAPLEKLAVDVAAAIPFQGPVNIQCRMRGDAPVVFEINPRFSGGIPLTIASGANFPSMLVRLALAETVAPALGDFRHDLWMTRYDAALFLPTEGLQLPALEAVSEPAATVAISKAVA